MSTQPSFDEARNRQLLEERASRGIFGMESGTVVIEPRVDLDPLILKHIKGIEHYEERFLAITQLLRQPNCRVLYVTNHPITGEIIDYYLSLVPDGGARERLSLFELESNPEAMQQLQNVLRDTNDAFFLPFNVTEQTAGLAAELQLPLYGGPPKAVTYCGSKTGAREMAREMGVPILAGKENLNSAIEVEDALLELRKMPKAKIALIKLNHGFSGRGNVKVDLNNLREVKGENWRNLEPGIEEHGAVVERWAGGPGATSPSAQFEILPDGEIFQLATHEQDISPEGVYLGCKFPANAAYRDEISQYGRSMMEALSKQGIVGFASVDFVASPKGDDYEVHMIEINPRVSGTTHPYLMAYMCNGGPPAAYVANDNVQDDKYLGLTPQQAIDAVEQAGIGVTNGKGVTLHLLSALPTYGKFGFTAVGDDEEEAQQLADSALAAIDKLAESR